AVGLGHTWPMQLRFHGGKGIATSLGALLTYDPFIVLCLSAIFLPVVALLRNVTLSGLLALALGPLAVWLAGLGKPAVAATAFLAILALAPHRQKIREQIARVAGHRGTRRFAEIQDRECGGIRGHPPPQLQDARRGNSAARPQPGTAAGGQVSRREHVRRLFAGRPPRRHGHRAREPPVLAGPQTRRPRLLPAPRPQRARGPAALGRERVSQRIRLLTP